LLKNQKKQILILKNIKARAIPSAFSFIFNVNYQFLTKKFPNLWLKYRTYVRFVYFLNKFLYFFTKCSCKVFEFMLLYKCNQERLQKQTSKTIF
jgi:hypothetical protein